MELTKAEWAIHNERPVYLFSMSNGIVRITCSNFGCIVTGIYLPVHGSSKNIVLAYDTFSEYLHDSFYVGCVVGRFANRINNGKLMVDGELHQLTINEPALSNHVHGGNEGFGKKVFNVLDELVDDERAIVTFEYRSPHLEEGYPGNVVANVTYQLTSNGEFTIHFKGHTDRSTHINLTNHTYFNLDVLHSGPSSNLLCINSHRYLESDERFLPTGTILDVDNSRFDFRKLKQVLAGSYSPVMPLFNTYYLFDGTSENLRVMLMNKESMITVGISTSLPGVLLYTSDYLQHPFTKYGGICLECQFPPDAPNHEHLPSSLITPAEVYDHYIKYQFSWSEPAVQDPLLYSVFK